MCLGWIRRTERIPRRREEYRNTSMPELLAGRGIRSGRSSLAGRAVIVLTASLTSACGGHWVDVPMPMSSAEFKEWQNDPKLKETYDTWARAACTQAGKSYTGEKRYERGGAQVKCK